MAMEKAYLLITDIDVVDGSYQLLHRLSAPHLNTVVYAIVPDFQTLRNLRGEFPHTNFLFLDLKKSVNVNKEMLSCLPDLDAILNYSGETLINSLHRVRAIRVAKTAFFEADAITVRGVHSILEGNTKIGTVLINVQPKDRFGCSGTEALAKLIRKESRRRSEEESEGDLRFHPGRRFAIPTNSPPPSHHSPSPPPPPPRETDSPSPPANSIINPIRFMTIAPLLLQETQPLIHHGKPHVPFWTRVLSTICFCCYPRCLIEDLESITPRFSYEQDIRKYTRAEQHLVLRRKLKKFLDNAECDWYRLMSRIDSDEVLRMEELYVNYTAKKKRTKEEERAKQKGMEPAIDVRYSSLEHKPDCQLARCSNKISPQKAIKKKKSVCSKKVTFVWDEDREYHEQADDLRKRMKEEKCIKEGEHYSLWVQREIVSLRANKDKYMAKYEKLYFETFRRPAPFE